MAGRRIALVALGAALAAAAAGCRAHGLTPREGFVAVPGGRVWYRIVGSGTRTPLLVIPGGPGAASYYLKALAALSDERPVVFYDELGSGHSDHPADTSLWHLDGYVARLARLRRALGLARVHLYGHSFGTVVAVEYVLTRPRGVKSLILAGPALDFTRLRHDHDSLRATLPDSIQRILARHESDGTTHAPEYMAAMMVWLKRFHVRVDPWPPDLDSSFAAYARDTMPIRTLTGPGGDLEHYDRTNRLGEITVPTLFTAGRYDFTTPATTTYYRSRVPGAELAIFEHSAHLTMMDEPQRYVAVLRAFLDGVDAR